MFHEVLQYVHVRSTGPGRFKGSSDQNHFIFELNVGKSRIRHRTTMNYELLDRLKIRVVLCRIRLFPTFNSKIKWFGSELPLRIPRNNFTGRVCLLDMTNINDSYLLSAATTAANVLFVLFIISLFVVGSMTGVYLCVCTVFHVSLRVHLSLYLQYLLQ